MHQNATVAQWYKDQGRHEVFARGKNVDMEDSSHSLILNEVDLSRPNKPEMEGPKTAAEEMQMMRKLYNQMVTEKAGLKAEPMIQIGGLKKKDKEMAMAEELLPGSQAPSPALGSQQSVPGAVATGFRK